MEILPFHIGALLVTLSFVLYADHLGFQYFRGTRPLLDAALVRRLHYAVLAGLFVMALTGFAMFWPSREGYLNYTPFLVKMGFVAVIAVNAWFIGRLTHIASKRPFAALTDAEKRKLIISGALSSTGWAGAITTALLYL